MANVTINQHYIPQFLLKGFGTGKKDKIHCFDKQTGKSFETSVRNIAAQRRFYDFTTESGPGSFEQNLSRMETKIAPLIRELVSKRSLANLEPEQRAGLAIFMHLQMHRTPGARQRLVEFRSGFADCLRNQLGLDDDAIEEALGPVPDGEQLTALSLATMLRSLQKHSLAYIVDKHWLIKTTEPKTPFLLGDSPVVMNNSMFFNAGGLGLTVPGIEIYLPLSSTVTLAIWSREHKSQYGEALREIEVSRARKGLKNMGEQQRYGLRRLTDLVTALDSGGQLACSRPENRNYHNYLQIRDAERYVFSSTPDFSLAERMIATNTKYQSAPKSVVRPLTPLDGTGPSGDRKEAYVLVSRTV